MATTKKTLLVMVQDILRDMSSRSVNSINDSSEAIGVANILRDVYIELVTQGKIPATETFVQLQASGSISYPCKMTLPDGVIDLREVAYNKKLTASAADAYSTIEYLEPYAFVRRLDSRDSTDSTVTQMTDGAVTFNLYTNKHPTFYTLWDQTTLYFDSYYSTLDSTLQASKSRAHVLQIPTFTIDDNFIPTIALDTQQLLIAEARARCFAWIKQIPDAKAEYEASRNRSLSRGYKGQVKRDNMQHINYGRR